MGENDSVFERAEGNQSSQEKSGWKSNKKEMNTIKKDTQNIEYFADNRAQVSGNSWE